MAILKLEVHINNFFYKKFFRTDPENPEKNGVPPKKNEILLHPNSGFNFNLYYYILYIHILYTYTTTYYTYTYIHTIYTYYNLAVCFAFRVIVSVILL